MLKPRPICTVDHNSRIHARQVRVQVTHYETSPLSFFCPASCSNQESEGFFCQQATYKGKYGKAKEVVESARAGLSPQKGDTRKSRKRKEKKKTKEGKKVAPAKARFSVPYTKNSFFLVHEYLGLESARLV